MEQTLAHYLEDALVTLDVSELSWTYALEPLTLEALLAQQDIAAAPYLLVEREHTTGDFTVEPAGDHEAALESVTATAMGQWATLLLIQRTPDGGWVSLPIKWRADEIDGGGLPRLYKPRAYGDRLRQAVYRIGIQFPEWEGAVILNRRLTATFDENADAATPQRFVFVGWSPADAAVVVDSLETMAGIAFMVSNDGWSGTVRFGVFDLAQDRDIPFPIRAELAAPKLAPPAPPARKRKR